MPCRQRASKEWDVVDAIVKIRRRHARQVMRKCRGEAIFIRTRPRRKVRPVWLESIVFWRSGGVIPKPPRKPPMATAHFRWG